MAPNLSEDEIDDLIYLARAGEDAELAEMLRELCAREGAAPSEILAAARDDGKATCLHMAAANGHAKTVTQILSHLPAKASAHKAATPAASASASASESSSSSSPSHTGTPYINAQNAFGNTALHWACLGGHLDVVKLLLSRGASPATPNDKDQIPLDLAAFNGHLHVVEYFLQQSRDIEGDNAKEGGGLEKAAGNVEMEDDEGEGGGEGEREGEGGGVKD
ncbi:ankyrin [Xylariaceae sp. FL0662B]|nr:ankyrin [Xylariaceae sp. FL0662B]